MLALAGCGTPITIANSDGSVPDAGPAPSVMCAATPVSPEFPAQCPPGWIGVCLSNPTFPTTYYYGMTTEGRCSVVDEMTGESAWVGAPTCDTGTPSCGVGARPPTCMPILDGCPDLDG